MTRPRSAQMSASRLRTLGLWVGLPVVAVAVAVYCTVRYVQNHQMQQHGRFGSVQVSDRVCRDGDCHLRVRFVSTDRSVQRDLLIGDHDWENNERHRAYFDARTGRIRTVEPWDPVANGLALGSSIVLLVTLGAAGWRIRRSRAVRSG